jgi:hypothetical protein
VICIYEELGKEVSSPKGCIAIGVFLSTLFIVQIEKTNYPLQTDTFSIVMLEEGYVIFWTH